MLLYWDKTIRVHWSSLATSGFVAFFLISMAHGAPVVQSAGSAPASTRSRQAALKLFAAAMEDIEKERYAEAIRNLKAAQPALSPLADHVAYSLGLAHFHLKNYPEAIDSLGPVWKNGIRSPYGGKAALLAARAHRENGAPEQAVRVLRLHYADLPQPEGDLLLAAAYDAAGDQPSAAVYYQRVYYRYPASAEADEAAYELARLRKSLGDSYPPPMPEAMLERAAIWLRSGQYRRAKAEFESLIPQLAGQERELARVRAGAAQYFDYETISAFAYLKSFVCASPEADAERLYYLTECARRLEKDEDMLRLVRRLGELYPSSPWRLKALVSVGNRYLVQNRPEVYEPLYRACFESFPSESQAAYCHWKVVWLSYLRGRPQAEQMLRDHLLKFPGSEKASTALYFLGRLAEGAGDLPAAKAYYHEAVERFPNHYYAMLAEERLAKPAFLRVLPAEAVTSFLERVVWPVRRYPVSFQPNAATRFRLERLRLLRSAGLDDLAEQELRFGAKQEKEEQPHVLGMELAQALSKKGAHQAIQLLKTLVPGYLSFPLDSAPAQFWKLLFPLPYRSTLERYARQQKLDPFLVAGLIRQESEFNAAAVSPARAYGLTQILPSSGRQLMRKLGQRRYRTSLLFRPDVSLRLGTYYLRTLIDDHGGRLEPALAAYNAGPSRAQNWLTWLKYNDPAEFIETIPFTETRTYVVAVLRNAEIYRRLYKPKAPAPVRARILSEKKAPSVQKPSSVKAASSASGRAFKRAPAVPKKSRPRKSR